MKKCMKCGAVQTDGTVCVCPECGYMLSSLEEGYDGYYDDVLPPDMDHIQEGMDGELIKRVTAVLLCVIFIIFLCVALLFLL